MLPLARRSRRDALRLLTAAAVGATTGVGAVGFLQERDRIETTRLDLPVAGWPPALDGFLIALLCDFHCSSTVPRDLLERAVTLALRGRPDLVVLGGDYVTWGNRHYVESAADALSRLTAPHGVVAVLGNHDDDRDIPAALARRGIAVLRDQRTRIAVGATTIDLVGIRFWTRSEGAIAALVDPSHPLRILLAHDPRRLREAARLGFPLVLSGHTHGGQVVLPGLGPIAARKFPVAAGLLREGPTTLFVSRGVGTVYVPIRWRCPPEVALLRLRPATRA